MAPQLTDPSLPTWRKVKRDNAKSANNTAEGESRNAKKRKREESNLSNPKLQEYLAMMQPGKRRAVEETPPIADAANTSVLIPDEASDEEYVAVPSQTPQSLPSHARVQAIADIQKPSSIEANVKHPPDGPAVGHSATTDDDWLRARSNRLLDIVDPEEQVRQASAVLVSDGSQNLAGSSDGDAVGNNGENSQVHDKDDPSDLIRATARLFLRNLSYVTTEDDLRDNFKAFGSIEEVRDFLCCCDEGCEFVL
jgi:multiple RNA-binding domain-containing protein 1